MRPFQPLSGLTLLELLVVLMIVAVASAGVVASLPDPVERELDRQAERLHIQIDMVRTEARLLATPIRWHADDKGYRFEGLVDGNDALSGLHVWTVPGLRVRSNDSLWLGPEPMSSPYRIELTAGPYRRVVVGDGWSASRIE